MSGDLPLGCRDSDLDPGDAPSGRCTVELDLDEAGFYVLDVEIDEGRLVKVRSGTWSETWDSEDRVLTREECKAVAKEHKDAIEALAEKELDRDTDDNWEPTGRDED